MYNAHSACPTALVSPATPGTYQVLPPTPQPTPYAVAYVAAETAPPALTLASVRATLLPLAEACGFIDVTLTQEVNSHGTRLNAHAIRALGGTSFKAVPLAGCYPNCASPTELLEVASNALTDLLNASLAGLY